MYIDWQTVITAGAVLSALGVLLGVIVKVHTWIIKQDEQSSQIQKLKEENCLICYALSACLDGLGQLGANHTVPLAKEKLDKYLNQHAHE